MFVIKSDGLVECTSGTIRDFAQDLVENIIPFVYSCITVEFNGKRFKVHNNYTDNDIINAWCNADYKIGC